MSKEELDHIIWQNGFPIRCTKTVFDDHMNNHPLKIKFEFQTGDDEIPASFEMETDATWFAVYEEYSEGEDLKNRAEGRRHQTLDELTDHSAYLWDKTVDVAADGILGAEISANSQGKPFFYLTCLPGNPLGTAFFHLVKNICPVRNNQMGADQCNDGV